MQTRRLAVLLALSLALTGRVPSLADPPPASTPAPQVIDAASFQGSALTVDAGQTVVVDFGNQSSINLSGNIVNSGQLFAVSSNPLVNTATFSALNITNQQGALFSSVVPNGGFAGLSLSMSQLNLVLSAVQNVVNAGSITSSGSLSINAGGSIVNALPSGVTGPSPIMQAVGAMNLNSQLGSIANAGLINSLNNNVNINTQIVQNLMLNNASGRVEAILGNINIGNLLADTIKTNTYVAGGNLFSNELNIFSGSGTATVFSENITGLVNIVAGEAYVSTASPNLNLGNIQLSGDPAFYNTVGNVVINSPLVFPGQALAIVANGDITTSLGVAAISTASGAGNAGTITMVAGAEFTATALIPPPAPGQVLTPIPDPNDANIRLAITGPAASGLGGKIDLDGGNPITALDASSTAGAGANVTLVAYAGTNPGSGTITVPSAVSIVTGGTTTNGDVSIIAGANSGTPISIGTIDASGSPNGGAVSLVYSQPAISGPSVDITGGAITAGAFIGSNSAPGSVSTGDLFIQSPRGINISSASVINIGNITTNGADLAIVSRSDIFSAATGSSLNTSSATVKGGSMNLAAGANVTWINPSTIRITGASLSGGSIDLSSGTPLAMLDASSTTAKGGDIALAAFAGGNAASGTVTVPAAVTIKTGGAAGTAGSRIFIAAGSPTQPLGISTGAIESQTTGGGNPSANRIDLRAAQPSVCCGTGNITAGVFAAGDGLTVPATPFPTGQGTSISTGSLTVNGPGGQIFVQGGLDTTNFAKTSSVFINGNVTARGDVFSSVRISTTSNGELQVGPGAVTTGINGIIDVSGIAPNGSGGGITIQNWGTGGIRVLSTNALLADALPASNASGGQINLLAINGTGAGGSSPGGPLTIPGGTLSANAGSLGGLGGAVNLVGLPVQFTGPITLSVNGPPVGGITRAGVITIDSRGATADLNIDANFTLSAASGSGGGTLNILTGRDLSVNMASIDTSILTARGNGANFTFTAGRNLLVTGDINANSEADVPAAPVSPGTILLTSNSAVPFTIDAAASVNGVTGIINANQDPINGGNGGTIDITNLGGAIHVLRPLAINANGTNVGGNPGRITLSANTDLLIAGTQGLPVIRMTGTAAPFFGNFPLFTSAFGGALDLFANGNITITGDVDATPANTLSVHGATVDYRNGSLSAIAVLIGPASFNTGQAVTLGSAVKGAGFDLTATELNQNTFTQNFITVATRTGVNFRDQNWSITTTGNIDLPGDPTIRLFTYDNTFTNAGNTINAGTAILDIAAIQGVTTGTLFGGTMTIRSSIDPGGPPGFVNVTGPITATGTVLLRANNANSNLFLGANVSGTTITLETGFNGNITQTAGVVSGNTVVMTGFGNFGSPTQQINASASNLQVINTGSAFINNTGPVNLLASTLAGVFQVTSSGQMNVSAPVLAFQVALNTATGSNAGIVLNDNVTGTAPVNFAVSIFADGTGSITRNAGVVTGPIVLLQSVDGSIGTGVAPIQTAASLLSINTGCTGSGFVNNTGATIVANSSAGTALSVSNNAAISVSNVRTDNGPIDITTSAGNVRVLTNTVTAANGGNLLLQTTDLLAGNIVIEANARLYAFSPVPGSGNVTIVVGPIPGVPFPGAPVPPGNVIVNATNGGQAFFGANGISAPGPNNTINVNSKSVVFDTNGRPSTAIQLDGGVTINATPFRTVVTNLDLTNPATVAELQAMQAAGFIGGTLISTGGIATSGDVIVTPANLDVFLRGENIPAGVQLTMQDFQAANPVQIRMTNCSTCQQVIIDGIHEFSATVGTSNATLSVSGNTMPVLSIGSTGRLASDGNLFVDLSGNGSSLGQLSAANNLTFRAAGNINASSGVVTGTTINLLTAAGSNANIMLGANIAAGFIGVSADGSGNITQVGAGNLSATPVFLQTGTGSVGTAGAPVLLAGGQARVLNASNAFIRALAPVQIGASTASSNLTISGNADLTILGALSANILMLQTLPGSNGIIDLQANLTGSGPGSTVTLQADGSGEISQAGGNLITSQTLVMSSGTGNIGTVPSNIRTATTNLTANTGGTGTVAITQQVGNVTLGTSSAGRDFNLIGMNGVTVAGNVSTLGGPIGIGAAFGGLGALQVAAGVNLTSNDGPVGQPGQITLINNDTAAGQITIGTGASLRAYSNTPGAAQIFVLIGTTITPTPNPIPANVNVTASNGGQVSFGLNGITAAAPTNNIVADTGNVFLDTGLLPANRISLGGAVLVSATPPVAPSPTPALSTAPTLVAFAPTAATGFPSFTTPSVVTDVGGPVIPTDKLPEQRLPVSQSTPLFAMTTNGPMWDVPVETDRGAAAFYAQEPPSKLRETAPGGPNYAPKYTDTMPLGTRQIPPLDKDGFPMYPTSAIPGTSPARDTTWEGAFSDPTGSQCANSPLGMGYDCTGAATPRSNDEIAAAVAAMLKNPNIRKAKIEEAKAFREQNRRQQDQQNWRALLGGLSTLEKGAAAFIPFGLGPIGDAFVPGVGEAIDSAVDSASPHAPFPQADWSKAPGGELHYSNSMPPSAPSPPPTSLKGE